MYVCVCLTLYSPVEQVGGWATILPIGEENCEVSWVGRFKRPVLGVHGGEGGDEGAARLCACACVRTCVRVSEDKAARVYVFAK